ncbi:MAG: hypothetical protein R2861_15940 [Desulfobacterales bacterium]
MPLSMRLQITSMIIFSLTLGGKIDVSVTTNQGNILYPSTYQNATFDTLSIDPARLAENFEILNEGIGLKTSVEIPHYSFLAIECCFSIFRYFQEGFSDIIETYLQKFTMMTYKKNEKN